MRRTRLATRHSLAVAVLLVAAACGRTETATNPVYDSPPGISVILGGASKPANATVWVDGHPVDYGNSHLTGLFVDDSQVYVAGRTGLVNRAVLWTDHVPARVSGSGAIITGLWVEDGDVSLVGTSGFTDRGTVWTIAGAVETRQTLSEVNAASWVVSAEGDDVYAGGTIGNAVETAGYWKNGEWSELEQSEAKLADLFVSDGRTYIVGAYGLAGRAGLWVDEELRKIDDSAAALSHVFVEDGNVYMAGFSGPQSIAAYWANGERVDLGEDNAIITDMFVKDGSVYLAGSYGLRGQPAFWVDGDHTDVDDPNAEVHLIFVTAA